ncbi:MAG: hypothetical protein VCB99_01975 [Myxococcota bacterium]
MQAPTTVPHLLAGADAGASFIKLAVETPQGGIDLHRLKGNAYAGAATQLKTPAGRSALRAALTGCGAGTLAQVIGGPLLEVDEFQAWGLGARQILSDSGQPLERFLLVSVGTGTSALLVEPGGTRRVGGTALGGGTLLGLSNALLGSRDFSEIVRLAEQGDRSCVDLLVEDLYPQGAPGLPGGLNAASFGKLARGSISLPADRAHALMGLLGENIGMLCAALAAQHEVTHVVFGGGTLRDNVRLCDLLRAMCMAGGHQPLLLPDGDFVGAVGALVHARESTDR